MDHGECPCGGRLPLSARECPHCGCSVEYPNLRAACHPDEVAELNRRHAQVRADLDARGCAEVAERFLRALADSKAVIARPLGEVERLARNDDEMYSTYYKQIEAEIRQADNSMWDSMRRIAEEAVFPGYKEEIRFASLTLDDRGLSRYGECFFTLRTAMIAYRTSVFAENNVLFIKRRDLRFSELPNLPRGFRATWADRGKLGLAKLGGMLHPDMTEADFAAVIQRPAKTSAEEDDFIEVHVYGKITIRTIEKVMLLQPANDPITRAKHRAWSEKLSTQWGVRLEAM